MDGMEEKIRERIKLLEKEKQELIHRIVTITKRLKYKKYERMALEPFLQQTKNVRIVPLRKQRAALEFKIATQAYTPNLEKELLKEAKKLDQELIKVYEVERARKKGMLVSRDIEDAEKEGVRVDTKLRDIREELKRLYNELKKLYNEIKEARELSKKEMTVKGFRQEMPTLEDVGIIIKDRQ